MTKQKTPEYDLPKLLAYLDSIWSRVSYTVNKENWLSPITITTNFEHIDLEICWSEWKIYITGYLSPVDVDSVVKELTEAKEIAKRLNELMFKKQPVI